MTNYATGAPQPQTITAPVGSADAPHVALERVQMAFGSRRVLDGLSCGFPRSRISVILGGSGSGKSTVLRLIGGLIHPQAGSVVVDGQDITRLSERRLYDVRRKLGMLFQGGALLDSYTVFDNLALPLREQTPMTPQQIAEEVNASLTLVGVSDTARLFPRQLSGGMLRHRAGTRDYPQAQHFALRRAVFRAGRGFHQAYRVAADGDQPSIRHHFDPCIAPHPLDNAHGRPDTPADGKQDGGRIAERIAAELRPGSCRFLERRSGRHASLDGSLQED